MKDRKEIENRLHVFNIQESKLIIIEILLDIRDQLEFIKNTK